MNPNWSVLGQNSVMQTSISKVFPKCLQMALSWYLLEEIILGGGGEEDMHMKGAGMPIRNFELNPKRRPIWA